MVYTEMGWSDLKISIFGVAARVCVFSSASIGELMRQQMVNKDPREYFSFSGSRDPEKEWMQRKG